MLYSNLRQQLYFHRRNGSKFSNRIKSKTTHKSGIKKKRGRQQTLFTSLSLLCNSKHSHVDDLFVNKSQITFHRLNSRCLFILLSPSRHSDDKNDSLSMALSQRKWSSLRYCQEKIEKIDITDRWITKIILGTEIKETMALPNVIELENVRFEFAFSVHSRSTTPNY